MPSFANVTSSTSSSALFDNINGGIERFWLADEDRALLTILDALRQREEDLSDGFQMRHEIGVITSTLSTEFGNIPFSNVIENIESLKDRYSSFIWFKARLEVSYDVFTDRVTVTSEYFDHIVEESVDNAHFRMHGQPYFKELDNIFQVDKMDALDFCYLKQKFDDGDARIAPPRKMSRSIWSN